MHSNHKINTNIILANHAAANQHHFGEYLMINGHLGAKNLLGDQVVVSRIFDEIPPLLGMKKIIKPKAYHTSSNNLKDCGRWNSIVAIEESHISPAQQGFVRIGAYTCRNSLSVEYIVCHHTKCLPLQETESNFIKQGAVFPWLVS